MVPASLPRTSGLRLLSYCNQSYSGIALRPLLSMCSSASNYDSAVKANIQQKRSAPILSLSISSYIPKDRVRVVSKSSRTFCTSPSVTADPSTPETTSSDDNKEKDEGV